jgi:hypothetical protein
MKTPELKVCRGCGSEFYSDRKLVQYCKDECKPNWTQCVDPSCTNMFLKNGDTKFCRDHFHQGAQRRIRPSAEELALIPALAKQGYEHTGDGTFWITWMDGTNHNPDFVDRKSRRVVEYFGKYWHRHHRDLEEQFRANYKAVGWDCKILWTEDYHRLVPGMKKH